MVINKKAQAQIITTVLIILLVLAAIVIVWQVIQGTVKGGAEEIESQSLCLGLTMEITSLVASVPAVEADSDADIVAADAIPGKITIKPSKGIDAYKIYVGGESQDPDGPAVSAFNTDNYNIAVLNVGDEVEVSGKVGETWCAIGGKATVE